MEPATHFDAVRRLSLGFSFRDESGLRTLLRKSFLLLRKSFQQRETAQVLSPRGAIFKPRTIESGVIFRAVGIKFQRFGFRFFFCWNRVRDFGVGVGFGASSAAGKGCIFRAYGF